MIAEYKDLMDKTHFADALAAIWKLVTLANKYIDETEPWVLAKDDSKKEELSDVMTHLQEPAGIAALLQPVMPDAPGNLSSTGLPEGQITLTPSSTTSQQRPRLSRRGPQSSHGATS